MKTTNNKSKRYNPHRYGRSRYPKKRVKIIKRTPKYGIAGPPEPDNIILTDDEIQDIINTL